MTTTMISRPRVHSAESDSGTWPPISWQVVCRMDDLEPLWGEAVILGTRQVALFRVSESEVRAVSHTDPASGANVMARGIVGVRDDRTTVASPLFKNVFDLETGACLDDPDLSIEVYPTRIFGREVQVAVPVGRARPDSGSSARLREELSASA